MSGISKFYDANSHIYKGGSGEKDNDKSRNGDVVHTVYRNGEPVKTEVIRVKKAKKTEAQDKIRRVRTSGEKSSGQSQRSKPLEEKDKFRQRLKQAIEKSQTLWNEKTGLLISYQGGKDFLVKTYSAENRLRSEKMMTLEEIMESSIPGLFQTGWKVM